MPTWIDPAKAYWVKIEHAELVRLRDAERRLAELVEAVRWERECEAVSRHDFIRRLYALYLKHGQEYTDSVMEEFAAIGHAARAAVDALVGEG